MNKSPSDVPSASSASPLHYARHAQPGEMLGHPTGLFLLFGVEMWERFSFYGMKAILVLYLVAAATGSEIVNPGRGWPKADATILMGWYGGMCYLLPIIGGIIADKFIGTHKSMVIGALTIAAGHVALFISGLAGMAQNAAGMAVFVFGLSLIALGTGHFKPCVSVMVGQLYSEQDTRRTNAFAIFYMGINVGAFLGQLACGYFGEKIGWHWGFGAAAVGMLAGLLMYLWGRPTHLRGIGLAPPGKADITFLIVFLLAGLAALFGYAYYAGWLARANQAMYEFMQTQTGKLVSIGVTVAVVALAAWFVAIQKHGDKGPTACIFIFMFFNAFFWLAFEQSGTSLNLFAFEKTERHIFGWEFPASWFQNVNPFFIVALTPVFTAIWSRLAKRNAEPSQPVKIALGLIILGVGYLFMVVAGVIAKDGAKAGMFWLSATYLFFTVGELCLSPTGLAFVTRAAPTRFVSLLMGIWFVSSFIAHLGGGYIAATVESIESGQTKLWWSLGGQADFYMLFVVASIGAGLLILILTPLMKKMLHGRG